MGAQKHQFQAAVTEVLSLVINSLYSNKDVFLRELISNASDALDKRRFQAVTSPDLLPAQTTLRIRLRADKKKNTLTISDNGVGMTESELVENLGTVAHSGSKAFVQKIKEAQQNGDGNGAPNASLIGQFGVGFYSAYLVGDRVEVISRAAGASEAHRWTSNGHDTFEVLPDHRDEPGTDVVVHLKADHRGYLEPQRLRALVERYSNYLEHSIELFEPHDSKEDGQSPEGSELIVGTSTEGEYKRINQEGALWLRPASGITDEQYNEFYKHLTHDWDPPLARRHFRVEGTQMFSGLLFLPKRPPFDLFSPDAKHGIRLHVQRVFIMDDCEALLPKWLRFLRGVVDSEDLPLNVSRELLQDSAVIRTIRKQIIKHALDMLDELSASETEYATFWQHFGAVVKEGLHFETGDKERERIAKLCRWPSMQQGKSISLTDYVGRMKGSQEHIYYALGATDNIARATPHVEALEAQGMDVLLMTDAIDQWAVDGLRQFDGKTLVNVMQQDLNIDGANEDGQSDGSQEDLLKVVRLILQDKVEEVRLSHRLVSSPACLVMPDGGLPPYLERLMRLQNADLPKQKRILELNPQHPVIKNIAEQLKGQEPDDRVKQWIHLLHDQALLAEGSPVEDPSRFTKTITDLLQHATTTG